MLINKNKKILQTLVFLSLILSIFGVILNDSNNKVYCELSQDELKKMMSITYVMVTMLHLVDKFMTTA